jgi:ribonuclease Z
MAISFQVLGSPGRDNALLARIDGGQSVDRLLFDCGEGCLAPVPVAEVQAVDYLFFSHLHMDHVGGFDSFFRCTYNRDAKPNVIWGPPETARILHGRFRGYLWNLHHDQAGTWHVRDIHADHIHTSRFEIGEAFAVCHDEGMGPFGGVVVDTPVYRVEALAMDHGTPSLAYVVREKPRRNIDTARLQSLGLPPGPWLGQLKDPPPGMTTVMVGGTAKPLGPLRDALVVESPGDSIAYLTDFRLDEAARQRLAPVLAGCRTVVCESQYRQADQELARRNYHMTAAATADLARRAGAGELILFHLSDRYTPAEWLDILREARAVFPCTRFPEHWGLETGA